MHSQIRLYSIRYIKTNACLKQLQVSEIRSGTRMRVSVSVSNYDAI